MSTLNQQVRKLAAGAVLTLGAIAFSSAHAAGIFTVNPTSIPGSVGGTTFQADFVQGGSTTLVTNTGGTNYSADGYIQYSGFSLNSVLVSHTTDGGLGSAYGLYATFTQTFSCPAVLAVGVTCDVTGINLNVFADVGNNDTFTQASIGTAPTVTNTGGDILLGTANVVIDGTAGINSLGGAFENVNTNFLLTAAGSTYFVQPVPFFNLAFSEFNNTSAGIVCTPSCAAALQVAITGESGGTQFLRIPEPASLGLLGIALAAAGFVRRRKG